MCLYVLAIRTEDGIKTGEKHRFKLSYGVEKKRRVQLEVVRINPVSFTVNAVSHPRRYESLKRRRTLVLDFLLT